jgi:hypothetical protein
MLIKTELNEEIEDDVIRYDFFISKSKQMGKKKDAIRLMLDIAREYERRGGFLDVADVEQHFIAAIEKHFEGSAVTRRPETEDTEPPSGIKITFDPSQYGI